MKVLLFMDYGPDYPTEELNKIMNEEVYLKKVYFFLVENVKRMLIKIIK